MESKEQKLINFVKDLAEIKANEEELKERSEWSSERSFGNYDDCFSDGQLSGDAYTALKCREFLKEIGEI